MWKQNKEEKKSQKKLNNNNNQEILWISYLFIGIFVLLIGNFGYFIAIESPDVINNTYNKRQELLAKRIVRGKILGNDGEVLAETTVDSYGNEVRNYPYKDIFCHIVGRFSNGRTGIEQLQNINLLTSGENPLATSLNEIQGEKNKGDNVVTTLDVELQKIAYEALGNRKGAVVALEPSTGKILSMVSKPDYDPNAIDSIWDSLVEDKNEESALINRATQGLYPPGSTFKILTALEFIRENEAYKTYSYDCEGKDTFGEVTINCYNGNHHGEEDLIKSFAKSCNTSFSHIGMNLDKASFRELCDTFLFNTAIPTNLPSNASSFVIDEKSLDEKMPQTAIGQGDTQITPLHNALITTTIANKGIMMKPYVVDRLETHTGQLVKQYEPEEYGQIITKEEAEKIAELMEAVVEEGTASALNGLSFSCAGKTGSAEYDSNKSSHAWFVGYAPADNPQIVVSVIVEDGGTGSQSAVPIAKKMFETYLN